MRSTIIFGLILVLLILPLVSADIIIPGTRTIAISNKISNINDFPDYVFISGSAEGPGLGMCELKVVGSDGLIEFYYQACGISIYAIAESNFDQALIDQIDQINNEPPYNRALALELFEAIPKIEVIKNIRTSGVVLELSTIQKINNFYDIDLEQVKTEPDRTDTEKSYLKLTLYLLISLVAIILIIVILVRRKK